MAYEIYIFRFVEADIETLDLDAVLGVLESHGIKPQCELDYVELRDGLSLELGVSGLDESSISEVGLTFRGVSDELYKLVFDLMVKAEGTALVVQQNSIPLVTSIERETDLPEADFAPPVVCVSWEDVRSAVKGSFEAWATWAGFDR